MRNIIAIKKTKSFGWNTFDIIVNRSDVKKHVRMERSSVKEYLENFEGIFNFEYEDKVPGFLEITEKKDSVYTFEGSYDYDYHIVDEEGLKNLKRVSAAIILNFDIGDLDRWYSSRSGNVEVDFNNKVVIYKSSY